MPSDDSSVNAPAPALVLPLVPGPVGADDTKHRPRIMQHLQRDARGRFLPGMRMGSLIRGPLSSEANTQKLAHQNNLARPWQFDRDDSYGHVTGDRKDRTRNTVSP